MTLLSRVFQKFPKIKQYVQKIPGSDKYINPDGLLIPQNLGNLLIEIGDLLYQDAGGPNPELEVVALIQFDEQQRIDSVVNSTVNGQPKIPSFQVVEKISQITSEKLKNAPNTHKIKSLNITVRGGNVKTQAQYYA